MGGGEKLAVFIFSGYGVWILYFWRFLVFGNFDLVGKSKAVFVSRDLCYYCFEDKDCLWVKMLLSSDADKRVEALESLGGVVRDRAVNEGKVIAGSIGVEYAEPYEDIVMRLPLESMDGVISFLKDWVGSGGYAYKGSVVG
jgi:hypothetical protein